MKAIKSIHSGVSSEVSLGVELSTSEITKPTCNIVEELQLLKLKDLSVGRIKQFFRQNRRYFKF